MASRTVRVALLFAAFLAGLVAVTGIILLLTGRSAPPVLTASAIGGPFRLLDQNAKPITDKDFAGKPYLVFFGFTHCPDICPTTLFDVSEVFRSLGGDADKARALFVSVDPERDTPDKLKDYLSSFDPRLTGGTGDPAAVKAMEKGFRVYSRKVPTEGSDYTMDHTAIVYLMDKSGRFVRPFDLKRKPDEAAADLRRYF